jgi:hypothetical protein
MRELIEKLINKQSELDSVLKELSDKKEVYETSIKDLQLLKENILTEIEECKRPIEEATLTAFKETAVKKYLGGIGVQERTNIVYNKDEVYKWALDKKLFLKLDEKAFEKVAGDIGAPTVVVEKVPMVTFPKVLKLED